MMPGMDGFELVECMRRDPRFSATVIMMLASGIVGGEAARCRQLGITRFLLKPIRKSELLREILAALGRPILNEKQDSSPVLEPTLTRLTVLVAEDNTVNATLMLRLLSKMGHAPVLARNGVEAVTLAREQRFDLIFMDVQMPEQDGFAATQAIRDAEVKTGRHTPIIAMTAHALRGDRERCLAAGMDAYIAKPVVFSEVRKMITAFGESSSFEWNREAALAGVENNADLLNELLQIFVSEWSATEEKLRIALNAQDCGEITKVAHSLKGQLPCLGCPDAADIAARLEHLARAGDLQNLNPLLQRLVTGIQELVNRWKKAIGRHEVAHRR
jgi:CheY-like chemotaxis protein